MSADVIQLAEHRPHITARVTRPSCGFVWQAVFPATCTSLECAHCGEQIALVIIFAEPPA